MNCTLSTVVCMYVEKKEEMKEENIDAVMARKKRPNWLYL